MNDWIAVNFAGGGLQDPSACALGQSQHIDGAMDTRLGRGNGVELIVNRRGWASKVVDFINLHIKRERDIVAYQFKVWIAQMMRNVVPDAGIEIVKAQDIVAFAHEDVAQMRAKEAGPSRYQNSLAMPPH